MKIGLLGFGTVASATMQSFISNQDLISSKINTPLEFTKVATRTVSRAEGQVPAQCQVISDCWAVVNDPDIDVVIELIGGTGIARELVIQAISEKKHVITANKALLAHHGEEIFRLADESGVCVLFEGAVAVSIPIIKTLKESAAANQVSSVTGILNGTSNYVLSQMNQEGRSFQEALEQAQQKGYAEADPTLDVNGEDAAHKITLLASLAFGIPVNFSAVDFKGITDTEKTDIIMADNAGYQLKLIAQASLRDNQVSVSVLPTLVPDSSMFAHVGGSMNGISLQGDLFGSAFQYGSGAGGVETASAVLADLVDLVQNLYGDKYTSKPNLGFKRDAVVVREYIPAENQQNRFYLRVVTDNQASAQDKVCQALANADIAIDDVFQKEVITENLTNIIVITGTTQVCHIYSALPALQNLAAPDQKISVYPIMDE